MKHKTHKAKFGTRLCAVMLCLLFMFLPSSTIINYLAVSAVDATLPNVSIQSTGKPQGNMIVLTVSMDSAIAEPVTVYYHTENRSAVAGVDYVASKGSVTISNSTMTTITIMVDPNVSKFSTSTESATYVRQFAVVLDSATNARINPNANTAICSMNSAFNIPITLNSGLAYVNEYAKIASNSCSGWDVEDESTEYWNNIFSSQTSSWNSYVSNGLAKAYTTVTVSNLDHSTASYGTSVYFMLGNLAYQTYRGDDIDSANLSFSFKEDTCTSGGYKLTSGNISEMMNGSNPHGSYGDDDIDVKRFEHSSAIYLYGDPKTGNLTSYFFELPPYNGSVDASIGIKNTADHYNIYCSCNVYARLYDSTAPRVLDTYLDDSSLARDGMLRLSVRFSEPVRTKSPTTSSVVLKLKQKDGTYYSADFPFYYEGGNYTDTLYYECKIGTGLGIYGYKILESDSKVVDLAYVVDNYKTVKGNSSTSWPTTEKSLSDPFLFIKPSVSASPEKSLDNEFHVQYDVTVDTGSAGCTVYYTWNNNDSDITDVSGYDFVDTFTDSSKGITFGDDSTADGQWYLHVMAVNKYGLKDYNSFGPFRIDRSAPELSVTVTKNTIYNKEFEITVTDKPDGFNAGVKSLEIVIDDVAYTLVENGVITDTEHVRKKVGTDSTYIYSSTIKSEDSGDVTADSRVLDIMNSENKVRRQFIIQFRATDSSIGPVGGNVITSSKGAYTYDTRDNFKTSIAFSGNTSELMRVGGNIPVYNIVSGLVSATITPTEPDKMGDGFTFYIQDMNGNENAGNVVSGLGAGYHELTPIVRGIDDEGQPYELVSQTYYFYLTEDCKDDTVNYKTANGNLVLSNEVFQLEGVSYTYMGSTSSSPQMHNYGATYDELTSKYKGGSPLPTFSSKSAAIEYLRYMEYQDMQLITVTESIADFLNTGTGSTVYVKADGEDKTAQPGQQWIRYKRATWTKSSNSYGWAYYFYSDTDASPWINTNALSMNLRNAINAVTSYIASFGKTVYLVGEDNVSSLTGAPFLQDSQMHAGKEYASETRTGSKLSPQVPYEGDVDLYVNTVTTGGMTIPLATNLRFSGGLNTYLYYKYYSAPSDSWTPIELVEGGVTTLRSATNNGASGIYIIREVDENGARDFFVYLDTSAPILTVNISGAEKTLDAVYASMPGTSFAFVNLSGEIDKMAYAAVYTYSTRKLLGVYYEEDLMGLPLDVANYHIEVGDRSGNAYEFDVLLASSKLEVSIEENSAGTGIIVKCKNREASEIFRYEVRCNNENIEVDKDLLVDKGETFRMAGVYLIYIQDIFGNIVQEPASFNYKVPDLTWSYQNKDGGYSLYKPDNIVSMVIKGDEFVTGLYNVNTSAPLRFRMSDDLGTPKFEFSGLQSTDYSVSKDGLTVTADTLSNWSVKIWYEEHPENFVTYACYVDMMAPSMDGSYIGVSYERNEQPGLIERAQGHEEDDIIFPPSLTYSRGFAEVRKLENGDSFSGNCITLTFTDPSGVKDISVKYNGKPIEYTTPYQNVVILNGYGDYEVSVSDSLGNQTTYSFKNESPSSGTYKIDGTDVENGVGMMLYGNSSIELATLSNCETEILLKVNGVEYYYYYGVDDGEILIGNYLCAPGATPGEMTVQTAWNAEPLLSVKQPNFKIGEWYNIAETEIFRILASFDESESASFRVECLAESVDIEMRSYVDNGKEPAYAIAELSKEFSDVGVISDGKQVVTNRDGEIIFITNDISLDVITNEKIVRVEISYSETNTFKEFTTIYEKGTQSSETFINDAEGFYLMRITNVYGNVSEYTFSLSELFNVLIVASYHDGAETRYNNSDENIIICANESITVFAYNEDIIFEVNGVTVTGKNQDGICFITFTDEGDYNVSMTDVAGNVKHANVTIGSDPDFKLNEDWIIGYNEDALRRDEGYTNKRLSINFDETSGIRYVCIMYDGEIVQVVYDNLSQNTVTDKNLLESCVGTAGDGVYTVCFRNIYGDLVTKVIHYKESSTLSLSRVTAFSGINEPYDLSTAISKGFYSNISMTFSSTAEKYTFKINGAITSLADPKTLEFTSSSGNGTIPYEIEYHDEYGFSHTFTAYLKRQEVPINIDSMKMIEIDGISYTREDVKILFGDDLFAFVSIDSGERENYDSGTVYRSDANYRFTIVDISGNVRTLIVIHDSAVHFTISDPNTEQNLINGAGVNAKTLVFRNGEKDTAYLKNVFLNGQEITNYDSVNFSKTGCWELIVSDAVGNTAYFSFTLLNHSLKEFSYDAPYGYTVTEVWKTDEFGDKQLTLQRGSSISLSEDGDYAVILVSDVDSTALNFTVSIDNTPPEAILVGCENGDETPYEVTLSGVTLGDTIRIFRDGSLISSTEVESSSDVPIITEGGKYVIEVENLAGVVKSFNFTKKHIANTASSVLIIVFCTAVATGVFIGLLYRNRSKTDD